MLDDDKPIDYSKFGMPQFEDRKLLEYFPKNARGVSFSSKDYNPLGWKPKAPNSRLELTLKTHIDHLASLNTFDTLVNFGLMRKKAYIDEDKTIQAPKI